MKIRIDSAYKKVYLVENDDMGYQRGYCWFRFQNKKDLINQLREEEPSLRADCRCLYSTIEERFNNI